MFIPEKTARTIRLNVVLSEGTYTLADGTALPKIKMGAAAELVVHATDLLDAEECKTLISERDVLFLPSGTRLWARVKEDEVPEKMRLHRIKMKVYPVVPEWVVPFDLQEDLNLRLRAAKGAVLAECNCHIPSLNLDAKSVNEAYARISTAFEPSRRSHTGNVFNCVFVECKDGLRALADLRMAKEAEPPSIESDLFSH